MEKRKIRRIFEEGLKLELVSKIESGEFSVSDVSKLYGVSTRAVYNWLYKYSELYKRQSRVIVERNSMSKKQKEQEKRIKELEQALGQKQLRLDYLEKLLDIASDRLGEDIEKKIKRLP